MLQKMTKTVTQNHSVLVNPGEFESHDHWYPKALNATVHPMIHFFMNLNQERLINRYCHLNPKVQPEKLREILQTDLKYFRWAGADLLNVTSAGGKRQMVVIENNSCPSGQKSMPLLDDHLEQGGYRKLMELTFKPYFKKKRKSVQGGLAVIYDKNPMEASGYAAVLADVMQEPVHYVPFYHTDTDPPVRFVEGVMEIRNSEGEWLPIRAAFRYVTQKPWDRIPLHTKTWILNPVLACLSGGRNKMVAAKAYDIFNTELSPFGMKINTP